ncbi:hypothetical protein PIB30_031987 [Stylosanthes scabra]|uniref:Uncharacterized protein n=1 Tax=Stylosanthes scabra TaxID=79078 RepID=A0ABU6QCJ8_9FABA|nr:hypothetical protein [Stylosanthes scabra]
MCDRELRAEKVDSRGGKSDERVIHGEASGNARGRNKREGEGVGGRFASGGLEGGNGGPFLVGVSSKIYFRDKVVGEASVKAIEKADSLVGERMASIIAPDDENIPRVTFTAEAREVLSEPYKESDVIKVLGSW